MRAEVLTKVVFALLSISASISYCDTLKVSGYGSAQQAVDAGWGVNPGGTLEVGKDSNGMEYLEVRGAVHHGGIKWLPKKLSLKGAKKIRFKVRQDVSPSITFTWLIHFRNTRQHVVRVLPRGAGYKRWQQIEFDISKENVDKRGQVLDIGMYSNNFRNTKDKFLQVADMEIVYKPSDRKPIYSAGLFSKPPKLDGQIDSAEWKQACELTGFVNSLGNLATRQMKVWLGYDDKNLYLAFKSPYESSGPARKGKKGVLLLSDFSNSLAFTEIWLYSKKSKVFRQYLFNLNGGLLSLTHNPRRALIKSNAKIACHLKPNPYQAGGTWYAEVAIPLAEAGGNCDDMKILFGRDYAAGVNRGTEDWTSSTYMEGGFNKFEKYPKLLFLKESQPALKLQKFGKLTDGDVKLSGILAGSSNSKLDIKLNAVGQGLGELCKQNVTVKARADGQPFTVGRELQLASQAKSTLSLEAVLPDSGQVVFRNSWNFKIGSPLKLFCIPRARTGELTVKINTAYVKNCDTSYKVELDVIDAAGKKVFSELLPIPKNGKIVKTLATQKLTPAWYELALKVVKADKVLAQTRDKKVWIGKASWGDSKIGISEKVPPPWTPVVVKGNEVSVIGRRIKLGDTGLPIAATTLGKELLASGGKLIVKTDKGVEEVKFLPLKSVYAKDIEAVWEISGKSKSLEITGELKLEYDGYAWWRLKVKALRTVKLNSIRAIFELPKSRAIYARGAIIDGHASGYSAVLNKGKGKTYKVAQGSFCQGAWPWTDKFFYRLFVGDDDSGMSILSPSTQYHAGDEHIKITEKNDNRELSVTLTGEQKLKAGELLDFDYAWAILPLRLPPTEAKQWHVNLGPTGTVDKPVEKLDPELFRQCPMTIGGRYTQYDSYHEIIPRNPKKRRKRRGGWQWPDVQGQVMKMNHLGSVVTVDGMYWAGADMGAPVTQKYINEWKMIGGGATWLNYYNTFTVPACANSSYSDYMIFAADAVVKAGINGVYLDVSAEYTCDNEDHGCGWMDKNGKRHKTVNLRGIRELHKRVYTHYKLTKPTGYVYHHHLDCAAWAGFCDGGFQGEEWAHEGSRPKGRYYERMKPGYFRAMSMTQYGPPYTFFNLFAYYQVCPITESMAICLPNKIYPAIWNERKHNWPDIGPYWKIMDPYWVTSKFVGYWAAKPPATVNKKKVYASAYCKKDSALLVVANWNYKPLKIHVTPNSDVIGFDIKTADVTKEIGKGRLERAKDGSFDISIAGRDVVVLKLVKSEK